MKNRNHIDSKVLARAAKWSKPKLRKKYTYKPKKITVGKFVKDSKDPKLQRKYAKYIQKKRGFKKKSIDNNEKVYNKFESMNNFSNLKSQNMEFATDKNKQRKQNKLKKLDSLAWESVTIPSNDKIFGSMDGIGNECGVGQLQVIDSKHFFANYNVNELHIEEYVLDSNTNNQNNKMTNTNDSIRKDLDIHEFNNKSKELLKLLELSLHKMNEKNNQSKMNHNKKRLQKKKSMKQKIEGKRLKALEKQFSDEMLIETQNDIEIQLFDLLNINANSIGMAMQIKKKIKQKWKQNKMRKLQQENKSNDNESEPPMKKRKLNGKKCEFRNQIQHLHKKQNIKQITKKWNELLLSSSNNKMSENKNKNSSNSNELLSHLKKENKTIREIISNKALNKYLKPCDKKVIIIIFYSQHNQIKNIENVFIEYGNDMHVIKIDIHKTNNNDILQQYNITMPTFMFMDNKTKKELKRIENKNMNNIDMDRIYDEINAMNANNTTNTETNTPLFNSILLHGISDLGFISATKIQKEVIPLAMIENGTNDILISAPTGSGKTLCFGIPIINDLIQNEHALHEHLYGLIITPTRELAIQIESHLKSLCKYSSINCGLIIGGMSLLKQERILSLSPEIIIGTPGRVWNMLNNNLHLRNLIHLRYLVLDEADKLLSCIHYNEMNYILNIIKTIWTVNDYNKYFLQNDHQLTDFLQEEEEEEDKHLLLSYRRQTFIASATLTLESINRQKKIESKVPIFANLAMLVPFQSNIKIIDQTLRHRTTLNVSEYEIALDVSDKDAMITYLLQIYGGRTLIFANTIGCVKRITLILKELQMFTHFNVYSIHSQQKQRQRLKNLDKFVKMSHCVLICTDICARGLDIACIDNIIHFQCPLSAEDYIHRTGRIGRHESNATPDSFDGNSFLLVCAQEIKLYEKIILALKRPNGLHKLSIHERLLIQIRRQVKVAKQIARLLDETKRKHRKTSNLQKMADAAGIELDEINCRALNIMKTNKNIRNNQSNEKKKYSINKKHKSFEYAIENNNNHHEINKEIKLLRKQLKQLNANHDLKRPKSSYLTKNIC